FHTLTFLLFFFRIAFPKIKSRRAFKKSLKTGIFTGVLRSLPILFLLFSICCESSGQARDERDQVQVVYDFQPYTALRYEMESISTDQQFPGSENIKFIRDVTIDFTYVFDHRKNRLKSLLMEKTVQNDSYRSEDQIRLTLK